MRTYLCQSTFLYLPSLSLVYCKLPLSLSLSHRPHVRTYVRAIHGLKEAVPVGLGPLIDYSPFIILLLCLLRPIISVSFKCNNQSKSLIRVCLIVWKNIWLVCKS